MPDRIPPESLPSRRAEQPDEPPAADQPAESEPRPRRRVRYSLRTLLLAVLLLGTPLGWFGMRAMRQWRQQRVADQLTRFGAQPGTLYGDVVQLTFSGPAFKDQALKRLHELPHVVRVVLMDTEVSPAGFARLADLPALKEIRVMRAPRLGDEALAALPKMRQLKSLWLVDTAVTDAGLAPLGKLTQLKVLHLIGADVTDQGLEQLSSLHNVEEIFLLRTGVTQEGVDRLQRALPQSVIRF